MRRRTAIILRDDPPYSEEQLAHDRILALADLIAHGDDDLVDDPLTQIETACSNGAIHKFLTRSEKAFVARSLYAKMTQTEVARTMHVAQSLVSNLIRGEQ